LLIGQLGVSAQDDPLDALPLARDMLKLVDGGDGVLILTDIYGATPSNLAMKLLEPGRIEGVAGVNLPMLLRAIAYRDKDMETLLTRAVAGGRDGVLNMLKH
jgi:PTS system ascorbate-specific IIA component